MCELSPQANEVINTQSTMDPYEDMSNDTTNPIFQFSPFSTSSLSSATMVQFDALGQKTDQFSPQDLSFDPQFVNGKTFLNFIVTPFLVGPENNFFNQGFHGVHSISDNVSPMLPFGSEHPNQKENQTSEWTEESTTQNTLSRFRNLYVLT